MVAFFVSNRGIFKPALPCGPARLGGATEEQLGVFDFHHISH
jgi:hypothetical protein